MKKVVISLLLSSSLASASTMTRRTICPNISEEGQGILLKIQNLKDQIKNIEECKPLADSLGVVNEILEMESWSEYKDIITGKESASLESSELDDVKDLTERATMAIGQAVQQLSGNANCVQGDKASFLSTLSGVTQEVSTLIGNTTGPYGMAISLGGNILSGVIGGIDQLFKRNKAYNFYNIDEELLFMNQFCAYSEIQKDINDYVGIENRKAELANLKEYLIVKQQDLRENCELCDGYYLAETTRRKVEKLLQDVERDSHLITFNGSGEHATSTSRCLLMHNVVHTPNNSLSRFFDELASYQNPYISQGDQSLQETVVLARDAARSFLPTYAECLGLSNSEKTDRAESFNNYIKHEVLPIEDILFGQQLEYFRREADKKYKNDLGDYTAKTMDRLKWIDKQSKVVDKKLADPDRETNLKIIETEHESLRRRIVNFLMPSYLNFSINRISKRIYRFNKELYNFERKQLRKYQAQLNKELTSLDGLVNELKLAPNKQSAAIFIGEVQNLMDSYYIADHSVETMVRYCKYLIYTSNLYGRSEKYCTTDARIANAYKSLSNKVQSLKAIKDFELWAYENLNIQKSRVQDYANKIEEWTRQGDSRWTLQESISTENTVEDNMANEDLLTHSELFDLN